MYIIYNQYIEMYVLYLTNDVVEWLKASCFYAYCFETYSTNRLTTLFSLIRLDSKWHIFFSLEIRNVNHSIVQAVNTLNGALKSFKIGSQRESGMNFSNVTEKLFKELKGKMIELFKDLKKNLTENQVDSSTESSQGLLYVYVSVFCVFLFVFKF